MPGASSSAAPSVRVEEADGSPSGTCTKLVFPAGTVAIADGVATITPASITVAPTVASGSSASGTPGTAICSVTAAAGKRLVAARMWVHLVGATSDVRITATMADDTTRTIDLTGGTNFTIYVDEGGALRVDAAAAPPYASWSAALNQGVKAFAATTLAAGTSLRYCRMAVVEVS